MASDDRPRIESKPKPKKAFNVKSVVGVGRPWIKTGRAGECECVPSMVHAPVKMTKRRTKLVLEDVVLQVRHPRRRAHVRVRWAQRSRLAEAQVELPDVAGLDPAVGVVLVLREAREGLRARAADRVPSQVEAHQGAVALCGEHGREGLRVVGEGRGGGGGRNKSRHKRCREYEGRRAALSSSSAARGGRRTAHAAKTKRSARGKRNEGSGAWEWCEEVVQGSAA